MLISMALVLAGGLAAGSLFRRLRLPALPGMLLVGILLGPFGLNLLDEKLLAVSPELRQIALMISLLRAGLALDLSDLKAVGRPAVLMCFVPADSAFTWPNRSTSTALLMEIKLSRRETFRTSFT